MAYVAGASVTVTIASGATTSAAVSLPHAVAMIIRAPAALTGTVSCQIETTASGTDFLTLSSAGTDVTVPANRAIVLTLLGFAQMRLASSAAEAAARTFQFVPLHGGPGA